MGRFPLRIAAWACTCLLAGCSTESGHEEAPSAAPSAAPTATAATTPSASASAHAAPAVNGDATDADELGAIPVLMYHQIIARPGPDDLTPDAFRSELQTLYERNFRPVLAADLAAGHIDVPAGTHPVVLTFDDSTVSQARIGDDGEPMPGTALGMIEAFGRDHPDFRPTATFFINTYPPPFVDERVIPWLVSHGYEVAAHTRTHANLRALSAAGVQAEIATNIAELEAAAPGYRVTTLAYPFGNPPLARDLAVRGEGNGTSYCLDGAFGVDEVAAGPPYRRGFDPLWIPRVGTGDAAALLAALQVHPERLYVSDGDPDVISFPPGRESEFDPDWRSSLPC
ncbi:MAG TPA: polysaccharide deacetylase family protein [Sporichthya sp.]|nr:polysaccharide deacetylase family protein [Sporichthya sp.]